VHTALAVPVNHCPQRPTREQDRVARIDAERALNAVHVVERDKPPPF
jgi:hypothetical protein